MVPLFSKASHIIKVTSLFFLKPNNWFSNPHRFINCVTIINLKYYYDHLARYFGLLTEFILLIGNLKEFLKLTLIL